MKHFKKTTPHKQEPAHKDHAHPAIHAKHLFAKGGKTLIKTARHPKGSVMGKRGGL